MSGISEVGWCALVLLALGVALGFGSAAAWPKYKQTSDFLLVLARCALIGGGVLALVAWATS